MPSLTTSTHQELLLLLLDLIGQARPAQDQVTGDFSGILDLNHLIRAQVSLDQGNLQQGTLHEGVQHAAPDGGDVDLAWRRRAGQEEQQERFVPVGIEARREATEGEARLGRGDCLRQL